MCNVYYYIYSTYYIHACHVNRQTLFILHFGGIRRILMSDSNRQVVKRAAGS